MLHIPLLTLMALLIQVPYQNDAIGLKMELPEGSTVVATSAEPTFCMISSGNPSNIWHLRLESGLNPDAKKPEELLKKPDGHASVVLESGAFLANSIEGWFGVNQSEGEGGSEVIARFLLPTTENQFILASFRATPTSWRRNSELFKQTVKSIVPVDPMLLMAEHLNGLNAATSILNGLDRESLLKLVGFEEWRRIQTQETAETPKSEIGYAFIQIENGSQEDVELKKNQDDVEPNGIIVTLRSRMVPNIHTGVVTDSYARYWMSWDGKEERWSNRVTRWMDKISATKSETGLRNRPEIGSPRARLLVLQDLTSDVIETPFKTITEEPWLPRALIWVLGPLLSDSSHDAHYVWRTYENSGGRQRVVTRIDRVHELPNGTRRISTTFGEMEESLWTVVDEKGRLVHQKQKGGAVVIGTTKEKLKEIWGPRNLW